MNLMIVLIQKLKHPILGLACFLFIFSSCKNKDKAEAAEFFERGNYHFKKNDLEKALNFYTEAIEKVPEFADAYNNRGLIYEKQGDLPMALTNYRKAVEIDDSFLQAKLNLASALSQSGLIPESQSLYENLASKLNDSVNFHSLYGQHLIRSSKISDAQVELQKALDLEPKNPEIMTNLGYTFYLLKNYKSAGQYFERAIKADSSFAFAYNNLSNVLAHENKWQLALEFSEKAMNLDQNTLSFMNTHALNLMENNKTNDAKELINRCLKIAPEDAYTLRNLAILKSKNDNYLASKEMFHQIEKTNPETDFIYYYAGKNLQKMGESQPACKYFEKGTILKDLRCKMEFARCKN